MIRSDYSQLIILLQAALGEMPKSVEKELDLKALFKLSQQQEIPAIALDGLQKLSTAYNGVLRQDVQTKAVKMQWIGSLMAQEKRYAANYIAAKNLSELYLLVGYNNVTTFRRAFKKTFGVTPSTIRDNP